MIPLFLGLSAANLLLLALVFSLGLVAMDSHGAPSGAYIHHIVLGIAAGLMTALAHVGTYTYFMATAKWLQAAADKVGLDLPRYVAPARLNKAKAFKLVILAVLLTMLTMFAGAGADPTVNPWWPAEVHLFLAVAALAVNLLCALAEYGLVVDQGRLMDQTLAALNQMPGVKVEPAGIAKS